MAQLGDTWAKIREQVDEILGFVYSLHEETVEKLNTSVEELEFEIETLKDLVSLFEREQEAKSDD